MTGSSGLVRPAFVRWIGAIALAMVAALVSVQPVRAQDEKTPAPNNRSVEWDLAHGGKLFDNWFATQFLLPPETFHPLLPPNTGIEAASSWRCSTCHGWDYRGGLAVGADGSRLTASLEGMRGADPDSIARTLRAEPHGFGPDILPDNELVLVARFVAAGQHDTASFADPEFGISRGNLDGGRSIYQAVCISCHNADGLAYIQGEPGDQPSLGWLSRNRTAQVLHKIRNGQPGSDMVHLRFLSETRIADLLAYLQALPDP